VEDRASMASNRADVNSLRNERVSLRDERASIRDDRISLRDDRLSARNVSLREERISLRDERISPRPSMDPLSRETSPAGDTSFVRSSMQLYEGTPADDAVRPPPVVIIPQMQESLTAPTEAAFAVPYPLQPIPSQMNAFYPLGSAPIPSGPTVPYDLTPPNPRFFAPSPPIVSGLRD